MDKDTAPQNIPVTDVPDDAIKDMTVDEKGTMQDQDMSLSSEESSQPTSPEPMMDVSPPPQDEVVAAPAEPTPEPESTPPAEAPAEEVVTPTGADTIAPVAPLPKKSGKGLIMAIAIVLALVLAAIAVLVYMKANTSTKSTTKAPATQQTTVQATKVTTADVDAAVVEVDTTLNSLNDTQDFAADVISDKALGLQ